MSILKLIQLEFISHFLTSFRLCHLLQMACCESNKGSLEEDSYDGAVGGALSGCALAMLEKEQESILSPSENPSAFMSSSSFQAAPLQGYDVEFDPPLESKYECPICLMALRNAIQTRCGHRFCKSCIEKSIRYAIVHLFNQQWTLRFLFHLSSQVSQGSFESLLVLY